MWPGVSGGGCQFLTDRSDAPRDVGPIGVSRGGNEQAAAGFIPHGPAVAPSTMTQTVLQDRINKPLGLVGEQLTRHSPGSGRVERSGVRALGRRLVGSLPGSSALGSCGLPVPVWAGFAAGTGPGLVRVERGRLCGGQLAACGSALRCGVCSPGRWLGFADEGRWLVGEHLAAGGWVVHATHSVPHRLSDPLARSLGWLFDGWAGLRCRRGLVRARRAAGVVGSCSVLHVTHGRSGYHPHLHLLHFGFGDRPEVDRFRSEVRSSWVDRVGSVTGRRVSPRAVHAGVLQGADGVWRYLSPGDPDATGDSGSSAFWSPEPAESDTGLGGGGLFGVGDEKPDDDGLFGGGLFADAGRELLSGVGVDAVRGCRRSQAIYAEYLTETEGFRRVPSTFRRLREVYGRAPFLDRKPVEQEPDLASRLWLDPRTMARLELHGKRGGSLVRAGLVVASELGPLEAARWWGSELGSELVVGSQAEDGAPVIGVESELVDHRYVDLAVK